MHAVLLLIPLVVAQLAPLRWGDDVKKETAAAFYARLAAEGKEPRWPRLSVGNEMEVGHAGVMPYGFDPKNPAPYISTTILQVVDEKSQLVQIKLYDGTFDGFTGEPKLRDTQTVWMTLDSTGQVDGRRVRIDGVWEVIGTKTYESANGAKRTVFHLQLCIMQAPPPPRAKPPAPPIAEKPKTPVEKPAEPTPRIGDFHTFYIANGPHEMQLVAITREFVKLRRADGRVIQVDPKNLSAADREWLSKVER